MLTACTTPTAEKQAESTPRAGSILVDMTPRENVPYFESGVHISQDTSVAIGILRYRATSDIQGDWLLVSRETTPVVLASEVEPLARLVGDPGFDSELWSLDGQYVAAEGVVLGVQNGVADVRVNALSKVSDLFPSDTNVYDQPGLYYMPDGRRYVLGWVAETVDGVTTLIDVDSSGDEPGNVVALIHKAGKGPPDGVFFDAAVVVVEPGTVPVVEVTNGGGYSPQQPIGMEIGPPAGWRNIERTGVKDLPGGKHRVVGILLAGGGLRTDWSNLTIGIWEPVPRYLTAPRWHVKLNDPAGLLDPDELAHPGMPYVAVEGILDEIGQHITVEDFELIPTP